MKKVIAGISFLGFCGVLVGLSAINGCAQTPTREVASVDKPECPPTLFKNANASEEEQTCPVHFVPERAFHHNKK